MAAEKTHWIRLEKSFFGRHDVKILEAHKNGAALLVFYLKLVVESAGNGGTLPFPAGDKHLAEILSAETETNLKTAQEGLDLLFGMGLLQKQEDGTLSVPAAPRMIGSASASKAAERQRRYRGRKKEEDEEPEQEPENVEESPPHDEEAHRHRKLKSAKRNAKAQPEVDYAKIADTWNALGLTQVSSIMPNTIRGKMLRTRVREYGEEAVLKAIENVRCSRFLNGGNAKGWTVTFDWLVKPNNFPKVYEGQYTDKDKPPVDAKAYKGAKWLVELLEERVDGYTAPPAEEIDRWAEDLNALHRSGYSWKQIADTMSWASGDDFWWPTLVSGEAVRKNFTKMLARRAAEDGQQQV